MKRIYLIILFSFIVVTLRGAVLPEASQCFRNSAGLLVKGLWNGDADMLEEAAKGFDSVESGPLENPVIKESAPGVIADPVLQFNGDYARILQATNMELIPLEALDAMRGMEPELGTLSRSIAPDGEVSITFTRKDATALVLAYDTPRALKIALTVDGSPVELTTDDNGVTTFATWEPVGESTPITLTLSNTQPENVSFTLAVQ